MCVCVRFNSIADCVQFSFYIQYIIHIRIWIIYIYILYMTLLCTLLETTSIQPTIRRCGALDGRIVCVCVLCSRCKLVRVSRNGGVWHFTCMWFQLSYVVGLSTNCGWLCSCMSAYACEFPFRSVVIRSSHGTSRPRAMRELIMRDAREALLFRCALRRRWSVTYICILVDQGGRRTKIVNLLHIDFMIKFQSCSYARRQNTRRSAGTQRSLRDAIRFLPG